MNAKYCLGDICKDDYPYYVEDSVNGNKICYNKCPSEAKFYVASEDEQNNIKCLKECEENNVHYPESEICIEPTSCETKTIKIKDKECVQKCSKTDKIFENGGISYCADNCTL